MKQSKTTDNQPHLNSAYLSSIIKPNLSRVNKPFMEPIFKAYATNDPHQAASLYKQKTGEEPTVMLIRSSFPVIDEHPALIRSPFGAATLILASHLIEIDEIKNRDAEWRERQNAIPKVESFSPRPTMSSVDLEMQSAIVKSRGRGRPKTGGGHCPHCQQEIYDFNDLGWWWGWEQSIEPPYWEELRLYVFQRDGFTCQKCHQKFGMRDLVCHHVVPKEKGGPDSARNLKTLCNDDHLDTKPIFEDE